MLNLSHSNIRGTMQMNAPLTRFNTWGLSGQAECLFQPYDLNDLSQFLQETDSSIPITYLGLGSNVLIRDGGVAGVVVVTHGCLNNMQQLNHHRCYAEAGVACAKLAKFSVAKNLTGVEFMAGIPGTIGGALAMNAGAFGGQTWDYVSSVKVINRHGEIYSRSNQDYQIGYRSVSIPEHEYFVAATFQLADKQAQASAIEIKELLKRRSQSQPIGKKNCGSVFKNPDNGYAAELIERCGLKGHRIGGASISDKHANFINNDDHASANDIEELINLAQQKVYEKFAVQLQPEVRIIGQKGAS